MATGAEITRTRRCRPASEGPAVVCGGTDQGIPRRETVAMGEGAGGRRVRTTLAGGPQLRRRVGRHPRVAGQPRALPLLRRPGAPRGGGRLRRHVRRSPSPCSAASIPGEVDESDPVRATAARRLAGMGVDIDAAEGWLAHYGTDWVVPGDGDGRRLAVLEEQGIHAEVTLPGPDPGRRALAGHVPRRDTPTRGSRWCGPRCTATCAGWPTSAPPRRAAGPAACRSTSTTWTAPSRRWPGPAPTASSAASCCPPCR